jgi:hypothetical protein
MIDADLHSGASPTTMTPRLRAASVWPSLLLPLVLLVVFAMHLRDLRHFLDFQLHYTPLPADVVVRHLLAQGGARPLFADPHVIAYLSLPLFLLTARSLHRRARDRHPRASAVAAGLTATGTLYVGGLFGMWTAFYDGLAQVDPSHLEGATATFAALTAPHGAFLLTTTLAKLAFVGLATQGLLLWDRDAASRAAAIAIALGSGLFLAFWDLDNWMAVGSLLLLAGLVAAARQPAPAPVASR